MMKRIETISWHNTFKKYNKMNHIFNLAYIANFKNREMPEMHSYFNLAH